MMPVEDATVIGRSLLIRGELSGSHDLLIQGDIEGVVRLPGARLTVQPEGHVRAIIVAQDLVVFGRVEGEMRVTGRVELRSGSVVRGDIFAAGISIEEGAALRGRFDPSRCAEPLPESTLPVDRQLALLNQSLAPLMGTDEKDTKPAQSAGRPQAIT
jgi:cytoskeletal protein CcmA (bactofilin family)